MDSKSAYRSSKRLLHEHSKGSIAISAISQEGGAKGDQVLQLHSLLQAQK